MGWIREPVVAWIDEDSCCLDIVTGVGRIQKGWLKKIILLKVLVDVLFVWFSGGTIVSVMAQS